MTITELTNQIQAYLTANDYDAIVDLLTLENVQLVSECNSKPLGSPFIAINDYDWLVSEYKDLYTFISGAALPATVLTVFTEQYLLIAQFGREYREVVALADAEFTAQGFADPSGEATTRTDTYYSDLMLSINEQPETSCL